MNWKEVLRYDGSTGFLYWRPRPNGTRDARRWNARHAGKRCGWDRGKVGQRGIYFSFMGGYYAAHRVIMEMHGHVIPRGFVVDHIDGNPANNVLSNLRIATVQQNSFNAFLSRANRLGLKGVTQSGAASFNARITVNYRTINLGTYPTKGLAALARAKAALRLHGKYARYS